MLTSQPGYLSACLLEVRNGRLHARATDMPACIAKYSADSENSEASLRDTFLPCLAVGDSARILRAGGKVWARAGNLCSSRAIEASVALRCISAP